MRSKFILWLVIINLAGMCLILSGTPDSHQLLRVNLPPTCMLHGTLITKQAWIDCVLQVSLQQQYQTLIFEI